MNRWLASGYDFLIRPWTVYVKGFLGPLWRDRGFRIGYRSFLKKCDLFLSSPLEQKDLQAVIGSAGNGCVLYHPTRRDGNLNLEALHSVARLVKALGPMRIFEIGTFNGNTTLQMAVNSPEKCQIFTLDLGKADDPGSVPRYRLDEEDKKYLGCSEAVFENTTFDKKVVRLFGDSAQFDFSPYYGKIDFVFIDGSHAFEYVAHDTEQAFRMVSPKGVIVWDDYDASWPDVVRFLNHLAREKEVVWIRGTSLCLYPGAH